MCQRIGRVMRGLGRGRVGALDRLLSCNSAGWERLRYSTSNIITASDKARVFPLTLAGISVSHVGWVLRHGRVVVYGVGMVGVWLVLSTLGTIQDASTDPSGTWSSTCSSSGVCVTGTANFRHVVCFPGGRECDRILMVGISVAVTGYTMVARAIPVVVKVGVVGSGSSLRSGKCYVLVELLRTPTADHRRNDKDQYTESDKSDHAERAGDSTSVVEETFATALHDTSR